MLKRFVFLLFCAFVALNAHADTETINWYVDGQTYATTTCESGDDILLPTTPTKRGYVFQGWKAYTPIEYLESTGTQYIDTGYQPNFYTKVIIKYGAKNSTWGIFGARPSSMSPSFAALYQQGGGFRFDCGATNVVFQNVSKEVLTLVASTNLVTLYNYQREIIAQQSINSANFVIQHSIYFPGLNTGNNLSNTGEIFIYYFQIYDNDILVRDFIPVLDSYGVPCMYDKVTHQFFYNAGTGDFIAGPVVEE